MRGFPPAISTPPPAAARLEPSAPPSPFPLPQDQAERLSYVEERLAVEVERQRARDDLERRLAQARSPSPPPPLRSKAT